MSDTSAMLFGDCLHAFLVERPEWSVNKLATALSIDPSLVRRWLRNERVPSLSSTYVQEIERFLDLTKEESSALKDAQLASLKARREKELLPRREGDLIGPQSLLAQIASGMPKAPTTSASKRDRRALGSGEGSEHVPLKPILGERAVALAAIELLARARDLQDRLNQLTICLTYQGERFPPEAAGLADQWKAAIRSMLSAGWDIQHLIRLNPDIRSSIPMVESILSFVNAGGNYTPYYTRRPGALIPPYELLVIPSVGSLIMFGADRLDCVDAAFHLSWSSGPGGQKRLSGDRRQPHDVLGKHFDLLRKNADVLLQVYSAFTTQSYSMMMEQETLPGNQFIMRDGLSVFSRPSSIFSSLDTTEPCLAIKDNTADEATHTAIARQEERVRLFEERLRKGVDRFYEVCPQRAVTALVDYGALFVCAEDCEQCERRRKTGNFLPCGQGRPLTYPERERMLQTVIRWLKEYGKYYQLALVEPHEEARPLWNVKQDYGVIIECWQQDRVALSGAPGAGSQSSPAHTPSDKQDDMRTLTHLKLTEPTIVRAFWKYADKVWESIAPQNRANKYVTWLLEQELARLHKQMAEHVSI